MPSLGNDLASLRKKRNLGIEELQQRTKLPLHVLRSIEDDSIFEDKRNNITYTRSYVRSYAKAIGIKEADIIKALDRTEKGNYDGEIIAEANLEDESTGNNKSNTASETDTSGEPPVDKDEKSNGRGNHKQSTVYSNITKSTIDNWDWVRVSRETQASRSRPRGTGLIIILLILVVIAISYLVYINYYAENDSPQSQLDNNELQQPGIPSDSLQEALMNRDNQPATNGIDPTATGGTLTDTLSIGIYAAGVNLEPVRVYTDILGQQNPYWIQQGDTVQFNFVNTVRFRAPDQYDGLQILYNGQSIQNYYEEYYNSESGMVELDRSVFENQPEL